MTGSASDSTCPYPRPIDLSTEVWLRGTDTREAYKACRDYDATEATKVLASVVWGLAKDIAASTTLTRKQQRRANKVVKRLDGLIEDLGTWMI